MSKKYICLIASAALILSISACSGSIRLDLPTATPPIGEETPAGVSEPADPQIYNSSDILFGSLATLQMAYTQIYDRVLPSVVTINVARTVSQPEFQRPNLPFNQDEPEQKFQERVAGSGFIWDTDGHIITNNHVIESADVIRVLFSNGTSVLAELVGADAASDLAVLKVQVPASMLKPIEVMDSTKVKVGQIAIAIGNPFQLSGSMTAGIISGIGRSLAIDSSNADGLYYSIPDIIQTDAAINPGNSGGPLVDIEGRLIGVTTAIESPVRANSGIGYVVPSIIVQKVIPILISEGYYQQPWIGISGTDMVPELAVLMDLDAGQQGALVIEITAGSPADDAGLIGSSVQAEVDGREVRVGGDVITGVDGQSINDFEGLVAFLARYAMVGQTINLDVLRDGAELEIQLTLAARPGTEPPPEKNQPEEINNNAWLGIQSVDMSKEAAEAMGLDPEVAGALVQQVSADSPANDAGIRGGFTPIRVNGEQILIGGDVIIAIDGEEVVGVQSLAQALGQFEPGDEVSLRVLRDGEAIDIPVTLGKRSSN